MALVGIYIVLSEHNPVFFPRAFLATRAHLNMRAIERLLLGDVLIWLVVLCWWAQAEQVSEPACMLS